MIEVTALGSGEEGTTERLGAPSSRARGCAVLIGREWELPALLEVVQRPPSVALVEGEAGIGKTRLIAELATLPSLSGRRLLVGHCGALREPLPLTSILDALRAGAVASPKSRPDGVVSPLLPELSDRLPKGPPKLPGASVGDRHRLFSALADLIRGLAPAILVLEDVHFAHESTCEFLGFLAPDLPEGVSLVLSFRPEDLPGFFPLSVLSSRLPEKIFNTRIRLNPLSPEEVGSLVAATLAVSRVSDDFASYLHQKTSGIPFVVEEVTAQLRERSDVAVGDGARMKKELDSLKVPQGVRDFVLGRVAELPSNPQAILRAAAILTNPASDALLIKVAGLSSQRGRRALCRALQSALLNENEEGLASFRHELAARAVYESIPGPERRLMHLHAARALSREEPPPFDQIAQHFRAAGPEKEWASYIEQAADLASCSGDANSAARLLGDALTAKGLSWATRARLATKLAEEAFYSLGHKEAIATLREVLGDKRLPVRARGKVRLSYARLLQQAGDASAARAQKLTCLSELKGNTSLQIGRAHV